MLRLYLDSSTIIKRYIAEPGTSTADMIFDRAENGELLITLSLWNIGEIFGVMDQRRRRRWLSEAEFVRAMKMLSSEVLKLMRLKALEIIPAFTSTMIDAWSVIIDNHIYQADALQITTCRYAGSDALLSGDGSLVDTSRKIGLKAFNIVQEEEKVKEFVESYG